MRGKDNRTNYIIFALICLIALNSGAALINLAKSKSNIQSSNDAIEVFSEYSEFRNELVFIELLSRTSSIINLYRNQVSKNESFAKFNINEYLSAKMDNIVKSQFPAMFNIFNSSESKSIDELNENNIEEYEKDPTIVEDFIIIDKLEEYEDLIIVNDSEGEISLENSPKPLNIKPLHVNKEEPYVLIYHTHGTESYSSLENNKHHNTNIEYNVTSIGKILANSLEKNGHKVEHVTKYHDVPSYNESYSQSLNTIQEKIKENSNFKVLLDIHRDGFDHNDPDVKKNLEQLLNKTKTEVNGKDVATFFFVVGPDSPNNEAVLNFAKYVKAVSDSVYPGLCTGIVIKPVGKYNQFLSDYSALIEIGSNLNTMEEAKETTQILGEILSVVIENIQQ